MRRIGIVVSKWYGCVWRKGEEETQEPRCFPETMGRRQKLITILGEKGCPEETSQLGEIGLRSERTHLATLL